MAVKPPYDIITRPSITREYYGDDMDVKPNDHCFWCVLEEVWRETDESLRKRIKDLENKLNAAFR